MNVIPFCFFGFLVCSFAVRYPLPEIRDEVPEKLVKDWILYRFRHSAPAFAHKRRRGVRSYRTPLLERL